MNNPWKGLSSYEEKDKNIYEFKGRTSAANGLYLLLTNNLFCTLYGKMGCGKTSLLQAGVFPLLRQKSYLPVIIRLNMSKLDDLSDFIIQSIKEECKQQSIYIKKNENWKYDNDNHESSNYKLWNFFYSNIFENAKKEYVFPVIAIDQIEEAFKEKYEQSCRLLSQLYYLVSDDLRVPKDCFSNFRVITIIREDDLYLLEDALDDGGYNVLKQNRFRLAPLTDPEAMEIINLGDSYFNDTERNEITSRILDLSKDDSSHVSTYMLSLICSQLFINTKGNISLSDIPESSTGLMQSYYESCIKNVLPDTKKYIEKELIKEDRRNIVPLKEFKSQVGNKDFSVLIDGEFKMVQEITAGTTRCIELIHDSLAKAINKYKKEENERLKQEEQRQLLIETQKKELERIEKKRKTTRNSFIAIIIALVTVGGLLIAYLFKDIQQNREFDTYHTINVDVEVDTTFKGKPRWEADVFFKTFDNDSMLFVCHLNEDNNQQISFQLPDSIYQHDSIQVVIEPTDSLRLCMPKTALLMLRDSVKQLFIEYNKNTKYSVKGRVLYRSYEGDAIPVNQAYVTLNGEVVKSDENGNFQFLFKDYIMTRQGCLTVFKRNFKHMQYELEYLRQKTKYYIEVELPLCEDVPIDTLFERKRKAINNLHRISSKYPNRKTATSEEERKWMHEVEVLDTIKENLRNHICISSTDLFDELNFVSCINGKNENMRPIYGWFKRNGRFSPHLFYGTMFLLDKKDIQDKNSEYWRVRITSFEKKTFHTTEHSFIIENPKSIKSKIIEIEY